MSLCSLKKAQLTDETDLRSFVKKKNVDARLYLKIFNNIFTCDLKHD